MTDEYPTQPRTWRGPKLVTHPPEMPCDEPELHFLDDVLALDESRPILIGQYL